MKWLWGDKDGGPESNVRMWGLEIKWLFSILVLNFGYGSREAFHSHAFNAVSWLVNGALLEDTIWNGQRRYHASLWPVWTPRSLMHKVMGLSYSNWVITFRGPWAKTWKEKRPLEGGREVVLTHGRIEVAVG